MSERPRDEPTDGPRPDEVWTQPFAWGLLMILDPGHDWEPPEDVRADRITATPTCIAVPVRHTDDFECPEGWPPDVALPAVQVNVAVTFAEGPLDSPVHFDGVVACPSGRLEMGDDESARLVEVAPGLARVQVTLFPVDAADNVLVRVLAST